MDTCSQTEDPFRFKFLDFVKDQQDKKLSDRINRESPSEEEKIHLEDSVDFLSYLRSFKEPQKKSKDCSSERTAQTDDYSESTENSLQVKKTQSKKKTLLTVAQCFDSFKHQEPSSAYLKRQQKAKTSLAKKRGSGREKRVGRPPQPKSQKNSKKSKKSFEKRTSYPQERKNGSQKTFHITSLNSRDASNPSIKKKEPASKKKPQSSLLGEQKTKKQSLGKS